MSRLTQRQRYALKHQRRRGHGPESLLSATAAAPGSLVGTMREYLEWCLVRQYTESTVRSRAEGLRVFAEWCDERGLCQPQAVTKPILERYQRWLFLYRKPSGQPLSAGTQHGRLNSLRSYFRWLVKRGFLLANPASELELPRRPSRLPRYVLAPSEVETVLALPDVATPEGLRDRAMLEMLYSTGLRRAELVSLSVFAVNAHHGTVAVFEGKGRKDRVVPIGERALAWVQKYLEDARPKLLLGDDSGHLFLGETGGPLNPSRLTTLAGQYVRKSGVAPRGACHLFRHVMATQMLANGADVRFVQEMLGHASLETTQVYTHVSIRQLKAVHAATHPAARLTRGGGLAVQPPRLQPGELLAALEEEAEQDELEE